MRPAAESAEAGPMLPRRFRVAEARDEGAGVRTLTLHPVEGEVPAFAPGQFNMLYAFGVGEAAISISGDPAALAGGLVHTVREVGAISGALTRLGPGGMLGVRGPFGAGWPLGGARGRHLLFVAGGLGLAPLRPAILAALARAGEFAGLTLVYGTRSPDTILYGPEIAAWRAAGLATRVTVDHAAPGWTGPVGVVTTCLGPALAGIDPGRVSAFVCGPEVMMRFTGAALEGHGVPPGEIWLSMERNMKCAIGHCGHCQFGPEFICRDGPVLPWARIGRRLTLREI